MEFLVGADPELFVREGDRFISAYGLIPGDKDDPFPVPFGAVQVDGMAVEFNIDPAHSRSTFRTHIKAVREKLARMVGLELVASPTAHFGREYIDAQPEKAKELGCNPDYNAYTGQENIKPNADLPFRTGAGHVHIGWTQEQSLDDPTHIMVAHTVVKELDAILGVASLTLDGDDKRREMYGKAGAYRLKEYGVEYRVLSNFWVMDDHLIDWVYDGIKRALSNLANQTLLHTQYDARSIIDNNDVATAHAIVAQHRLMEAINV